MQLQILATNQGVILKQFCFCRGSNLDDCEVVKDEIQFTTETTIQYNVCFRKKAFYLEILPHYASIVGPIILKIMSV